MHYGMPQWCIIFVFDLRNHPFLPVSGRTTICKQSIMPSLQAVVCLCDLATAAVLVPLSALPCAAGWLTF